MIGTVVEKHSNLNNTTKEKRVGTAAEIAVLPATTVTHYVQEETHSRGISTLLT